MALWHARWLAAALLVLTGAGPSGAGSAGLTGDSAACVVEVNKQAASVARTTGKEQLRCLKLGAAEKEDAPGICRFVDARGKVGRATEKAAKRAAKKCAGGPPPFGYTGSESSSEIATSTSMATLGDVLGASFDEALKTKKGDKDGAKCQADVAKRVLAVHDTVWSEVAKAKKKILGGKTGGAASASELADAVLLALQGSAKLGKREAQLLAGVGKRCSNRSDLERLLPGPCVSEEPAGLAGCAVRRARCHACVGVRRSDLLPLDCDAFDDGEANASCTWPLPTNVSPDLDEVNAAEETIGPGGGIVVATGGDGTVFTLDVPGDVLEEDVAIRMTPVTAIPDLPIGTFLAAVQLEPNGLQFPVPDGATLTIELTAPPAEPFAYGWLGGGDDFHLRLAEASGTTLTYDIFHFSGAGGGNGNPSGGLGGFGSSGWALRAQNDLAALGGQNLDLATYQQRAAQIMRDWMRDGVLRSIARGANADAFFSLAVAETFAWLRAAIQLTLLDNIWGEGELEADAEVIRQQLSDAFHRASDRIVQRCEFSGDVEAYLQDVLDIEENILSLGLDAEPFLENFQGRCVTVEVEVVDVPDSMEPEESAPLQLRAWWNGPTGRRNFDNPPVFIQMNTIGGSVTPDDGDIDPTTGLFDATIRADEDPPVGIRITVSASLRLILEADPLEIEIGDPPECGWPADQMPPGSYDQTCQNCSVSGTDLTCDCRRIGGGDIETSIDFADCDPEEDLSNIDGNLRCSECG